MKKTDFFRNNILVISCAKYCKVANRIIIECLKFDIKDETFRYYVNKEFKNLIKEATDTHLTSFNNIKEANKFINPMPAILKTFGSNTENISANTNIKPMYKPPINSTIANSEEGEEESIFKPKLTRAQETAKELAELNKLINADRINRLIKQSANKQKKD